MSHDRVLQNALALVGITGWYKGLHWKTKSKAFSYVELNSQMFGPMYILNDAGKELAQKSRLWAAHEWMTERGFVPTGSQLRRARLGCISYHHPDNDAHGFIGDSGRVYATDESGKFSTMKLRAECKHSK